MEQGFVKVAALTPKIRVADVYYNTEIICEQIKEAAEKGAKVIVLPELCITGYTCGDLFWQEKLLADIADEIVSKNKRIILIAGPSSSGKTTFSHRFNCRLLD